MSKIFISDLHIGHSLSHYKEFFYFFKNDLSDSIFFIGDIFDTWFLPYNKIKEQYKEFFDLIKQKIKDGVKIYYIIGNHENSEVEIDKDFNGIIILNSYIFEVDGIKVKLIHGDQFDWTIKKINFIMRFFYIIQKYLLKIFGANIFKKMRRNISRMLGKDKGLLQSIRDNALEHYKSDFNALIIGHSHYPEFLELDSGFIYMNTGDWLEDDHNTYIEYDGEFKLKHYTGEILKTFSSKQMKIK